MKIIATSDWHLGNMFHCNDRLPEHRHFLNWLLELIESEQPDALLIAGDVFDNGNPSAAAQKTYYEFLGDAVEKCHKLHIIVSAGNHDSASRLEAVQPILHKYRVTVRGNVERNWDCELNDGKGGWNINYQNLMIELGDDVVVLAVPYLRSDIVMGQNYSSGVMNFLKELTSRARQTYPGRKFVLMGHMYAKGAEISAESSEKIVIGGQEEVNMEGWEDHPDWFTCGHIHKRQHIWNTKWARYTGSVLPMSFAEKDYTHGVDLITIEGDKINAKKVDYQPEHALIVLPSDGEAATPKQLTKLINATLPERESEQLSDHFVYVMLRVRQDKASNDEISAVEQLTKSKDAVLCRTVKVFPQSDVEAMSERNCIESIDDVLNRDPMETLREAFELHHKVKLNPEQEELLSSIINKVKTI